MKFKINKFKIEKKRHELNKLIREDSSNLLRDEVQEVSQELDNIIKNIILFQTRGKL